jgi:hypothetical protein
MKIYDELTGAELTAPDLDAGYLYDGQRVVRHVPEHDEILEGTDGWRHRIPAHDEYEACQYYHAYTEAELAERDKPTAEQRLDALESANDDIILMMADLIGGEE